MAATISFQIPTPAAGEDTPTSVVWYDSAVGSTFAEIGRSLISALTYDDVTETYTWELSGADTARYQLIKTATAGGVEAFTGVFLPPLPGSPALQTLYGSVKEFGAESWSVGDTVEMTMLDEQLVNGIVLEPVVRTDTVDANGQFSFLADKGAEVCIKAKYQSTGKVYFSKSFTVSTANTQDVKDY